MRPLHYAAEGLRKCAVISRLLLAAGADVNATDGDCRTPLHWAAEHGNVGAAAVLLGHGAHVNARDWMDRTPLHWATVGNSVGVPALLLAYGADVNVRDRDRATPLHLIIVGDNAREVGALLLEQGVDLSARDVWGRTPLHTAASGGEPTFVQLLIAHGADVNALDARENSVLDRATGQEVKQLLRQHGALPGKELRRSTAPTRTGR